MSKNKIIHPRIDNEIIEIKSKVKNVWEEIFDYKPCRREELKSYDFDTCNALCKVI